MTIYKTEQTCRSYSVISYSRIKYPFKLINNFKLIFK